MSAATRATLLKVSWTVLVMVLASLPNLTSCIHLGWVELQCTEEKEALQYFPHATELQWMYLANFNTVVTLEIMDRSRKEHVPPPLSYQETE